MSSLSNDAATGPLFITAIGLLGVLLGLLAELLIVRVLPRLGGLPAPKIRMTTAALTGALCAALAFRFGAAWILPAFLLLAVLGVQLSRIDIAHHLLPNPLVIALLIAGALLLTVSAGAAGTWGNLLRALAGGAILFAIYLILAIISPGGIGMGDVKLAAPIGMYLGHLGWTQLFYGGALGFVAGGVMTFLLTRRNLAEKAAEVAYGPSMLAAALGITLFAS